MKPKNKHRSELPVLTEEVKDKHEADERRFLGRMAIRLRVLTGRQRWYQHSSGLYKVSLDPPSLFPPADTDYEYAFPISAVQGLEVDGEATREAMRARMLVEYGPEITEQYFAQIDTTKPSTEPEAA